jgi:hypothetical protein
MPLHRLAGIVIGVAIYAAGAYPALADAIDGHWCFPDGRRMFIQGPAITTPGGSRIQGEYGRHFFSYVIPPADQGSGQTVSMALVNEDTVHLRIGTGPAYSSDAPVQVWHRCGPPTS